MKNKSVFCGCCYIHSHFLEQSNGSSIVGQRLKWGTSYKAHRLPQFFVTSFSDFAKCRLGMRYDEVISLESRYPGEAKVFFFLKIN